MNHVCPYEFWPGLRESASDVYVGDFFRPDIISHSMEVPIELSLFKSSVLLNFHGCSRGLNLLFKSDTTYPSYHSIIKIMQQDFSHTWIEEIIRIRIADRTICRNRE